MMNALPRWGRRIAASVIALLGFLPAPHSFAQPGTAPIQLAPKRLAERYRGVIEANDLTDDEKKVLLSVLEKCAEEQFVMSEIQKAEAIDILKALLKVTADANPWWLGFVSGETAPPIIDEKGNFQEKRDRYLPQGCLSIRPRS